MNRLTITLKQHTPLLHFQPMQEGATLRASEVKPKLDKFLIEKLKNEGRSIPKDWLLPNHDPEVRALNYKMRISAGEQEPEYYMVASYLKKTNIEKLQRQGINVLANTPYFAQEKQNGQISKAVQNDEFSRVKFQWDELPVKGIKYTNPLELTICSKSEDLVRNIAANIQLFFLVNNFGTRQNKGFGSFTVKTINLDDNNTKKLTDNEKLMKTYCDNLYKCGRNANPLTLLSHISKDYSWLKRGNTDRASLLNEYVKNEHKKYGEKGFIKRKSTELILTPQGKVLESTQAQKLYVDDNKNYRYVRAVLGLAEQYEFLLKGTRDKLVVNIESQSKAIERFSSPLLFKIIKNELYLIVNEIPNEMKDASFSFEGFIKQNNERDDKQKQKVNIGTLQTLSDFSVVGFIDYAIKNGFNYEKL